MTNSTYDLNTLVHTYDIDNIYEQYKRLEFIEKLSLYINLKSSSVLEFGPATGQMTELLSSRVKNVVAVDGSNEFIKIAKNKVKNANNVTFYESYFEDFILNEKFDCLIFHHIIEHLENPQLIFGKLIPFLKKDSIIAISVPNSHALSRQLAVKMGLLNSVYDLTENDKNHGHYTVYDWCKTENLILKSGYSIIGRHGLSFKLFSDKQNVDMLINNIIAEEQIKGLWKLADELKEYAGAIMIIAKNDKAEKLGKSFTQKNAERQKLINILPVRMPLGLCIEPTNKCNFKCIQCALSLDEFNKIVGPRMNMPIDLYKKILNDIRSMGKLNNLNIYGDGEPLLHPDIAELVSLAKENDVAEAITITTNASLLTEKVAKNLIESRLDYLRISVYSIYDNIFKKITNTQYDADLIFNNVKQLFKIRNDRGGKTPFIYVKLIDTYSKENEDFLSKYNFIADEVNIETPMNWNSFNNIDLISNIDRHRKTNEKTLQGYYGKHNISNVKKICTTPFLSLNIKSNGDVCICIVDWNKGTKIGNISTVSLSEIWYGDTLREFRRMHIEQRKHENESCRNCKFMYCNPDNMDDFPIEKYNEILNFNGDI